MVKWGQSALMIIEPQSGKSKYYKRVLRNE
jgi:hypothetical protein